MAGKLGMKHSKKFRRSPAQKAADLAKLAPINAERRQAQVPRRSIPARSLPRSERSGHGPPRPFARGWHA